MEEQMLPTIRDMYNCTRENHDYNAIKVYDGPNKNFAMATKPTKKDHYLNQVTRLNCSPGPANSANSQSAWLKKNDFQTRRAEKQTYLDEICKKEKKNNSPSPNHYSIEQGWPKKRDQLKNISEKTNFADTCQFYSDKTPGPGSYNTLKHLGTTKSDKKFEAHQPIKPREVVAAEVGTYSPCPLDYHTFARSQLTKSESQPTIDKKLTSKSDKNSKENQSPGPAAYSTVNHWGSRSPVKKKQKEINFFKVLSKAPSAGVYH